MSPGRRLLIALLLVLLVTVLGTVASLGVPPALVVLCSTVGIILLAVALRLFLTALGRDSYRRTAAEDAGPWEDE